jgi:hypothetical protein
MDNMIVQGLIWVAAAACMLLYFKRRRDRKSSIQ